MNQVWTSIVTVASGVLVIAIIAVIVKKNAATVDVVKAATGGLATDIRAAVKPISG